MKLKFTPNDSSFHPVPFDTGFNVDCCVGPGQTNTNSKEKAPWASPFSDDAICTDTEGPVVTCTTSTALMACGKLKNLSQTLRPLKCSNVKLAHLRYVHHSVP